MHDNIAEQISIEEKIAQLFIVGMKAYSPSKSLVKLLQIGLGGIIFFEHNILSLQQLNACMVELQEYAKTPLLFSVDQEGGLVERIKGITSIPSFMALGAMDDIALTKKIAEVSAKELEFIGINCCFSPVLDVNTCIYNPVIGVRSFGDNPDKVISLGQVFIEAYQNKKIIPVGKHFPGHGGAFADSHFELPLIDCSEEEFETIHLRPFKEAIEKGLDAIMVCHAVYPSVQKEQYLPASLSRIFIKGILREQWEYDGLIISDDMVMGAISKSYDPKMAALGAIVAGVDMLIYRECNDTVVNVYRYLVDSVHNGSLPEVIIEEAYQRVIRIKQKYGLFERRIPLIETNHLPSSKTHIELSKSAALKSLTLLKNDKNVIPLSEEDDILIMAPDKSIIPHYKTDYPGITVGYFVQQEIDSITEIFYNPGASEDDMMNHLPYASKFKTVVFLSYNGSLLPAQMKFLNSLPEEVDVIAVVLGNPYDAIFIECADAVLLTYGYRASSIEAIAKVLLGMSVPEGKVPVCLTLHHKKGI